MTKREMLENLEVQVGALGFQVGKLARRLENLEKWGGELDVRMDSRTRELADLGGRFDILHAQLKSLTRRIATLELSVSTRDYRVPKPSDPPHTYAEWLNKAPEGVRDLDRATYMGMEFAEEVPAPVVPSTEAQMEEARGVVLVPGEWGWIHLSLDRERQAVYTRLREQGRTVLEALEDLGLRPEGVAR